MGVVAAAVVLLGADIRSGVYGALVAVTVALGIVGFLLVSFESVMSVAVPFVALPIVAGACLTLLRAPLQRQMSAAL